MVINVPHFNEMAVRLDPPGTEIPCKYAIRVLVHIKIKDRRIPKNRQ
jgi:hypothetical protein